MHVCELIVFELNENAPNVLGSPQHVEVSGEQDVVELVEERQQDGSVCLPLVNSRIFPQTLLNVVIVNFELLAEGESPFHRDPSSRSSRGVGMGCISHQNCVVSAVVLVEFEASS